MRHATAQSDEMASLGRMMLLSEVPDETPCVWSDTRNALVWSALYALKERCKAIEFLTIYEELKTHGDLEDAGGPYYLFDLVNAFFNAADLGVEQR